jgi:hypothetical protein
MKQYLVLATLLLLSIGSFGQNNYSTYYDVRYDYSYLKNIDPEQGDEQSPTEETFRKAFSLNTALATDLACLATKQIKSGNTKKGKKYLLKTALAGYDVVNGWWESPIDSMINEDAKLRALLQVNYEIFLTKKCDLINSAKISRLFMTDQNVRTIASEFCAHDSLSCDFGTSEMIKYDSINYFTLLEILETPGFNSAKLTGEAQLGLGIILTHSATQPYANADSVFALLKKEILNGILSPQFYANSFDRYYFAEKGLNYYCSLYNSNIPIYDIANIDKRRAEVWLYPLYFKFKWNKQLDKLPKDYSYDPKMIR